MLVDKRWLERVMKIYTSYVYRSDTLSYFVSLTVYVVFYRRDQSDGDRSKYSCDLGGATHDDRWYSIYDGI